MVDLELNELKREFLGEAREKVDEMQSALQDLENAASLDRLAYLSHQLKGSGGSYGYERISREAAELERAIESLAGSNGDGADIQQDVRRYVSELRGEIDRALEQLG